VLEALVDKVCKPTAAPTEIILYFQQLQQLAEVAAVRRLVLESLEALEVALEQKAHRQLEVPAHRDKVMLAVMGRE
jgi:hypothetical protein